MVLTVKDNVEVITHASPRRNPLLIGSMVLTRGLSPITSSDRGVAIPS